MRVLFTGIIAALALTGTAPNLAAQTPPAPIVKVEGLRQISPRVQIIPDNSVPAVPNVGYVVGDRAVLVIDTGLGPPNGKAVYEVAKKLAGEKPLYLVTTHVHPEHDLGAQAFPSTTTLIRSTDQVKDIAEFGLQLFARLIRRHGTDIHAAHLGAAGDVAPVGSQIRQIDRERHGEDAQKHT